MSILFAETLLNMHVAAHSFPLIIDTWSANNFCLGIQTYQPGYTAPPPRVEDTAIDIRYV